METKSKMMDKEFIPLLLAFAAEYKVDNILRLVVDRCPRLIGAREASLFWMDRERNRIVLRETYEGNREYIGKRFYEIGEGLTGWVAKTGKPLRLRNIENDEEKRKIRPAPKWSDKYGGFHNSRDKDKQRAFLAVPIKIEEVVVGVLRIARTEELNATFTQEDESLLVTFAGHLSDILKKAEIIERAQNFDQLIDQNFLRDSRSLDDYLKWAANAVTGVLNAQGCNIFLRGYGNSYVLRAASDNSVLADLINQAEYRIGEGLTGWVLLTGEPLKIANVQDSDEIRRIHPALKWKGKYARDHDNSASYLAAPIKAHTEMLGVIRVVKSSDELPFTTEDVRLLSRYGERLGLLLQSLELSEQQSIIVRPKWPGKYQMDNKLCYVLMPFAKPWSDLVRAEIKTAATKAELKVGIADEDQGHFIMQDVWRGICQARVVVADLTEGNPNVAYEVGLADAVGKDIILLAQDPTTVPFDFQGARLLVYNVSYLDKLQAKLVERMMKILAGQKAIVQPT